MYLGPLPPPEVGDWFLIPEELAPVSKRVKQHPWIIVRREFAAQVLAVFRTTQPGYQGVWHDPHVRGHEATCVINTEGRVCTFEGREIPLHVFRSSFFSCKEPVGPVRDEILEVSRPQRRPGRRRR